MAISISVVDYDMGNLRSVAGALKRLGASCEITTDAAGLDRADGIILPGVGAFGDAASALERHGLRDSVRAAAAAAAAGTGRPFLGICLGLQLLFDNSEESPGKAGLGVLPGRSILFPEQLSDGTTVKVPHMGWNSVRRVGNGPVCSSVTDGEYFYFVHSYCAIPEKSADMLLECQYAGVRFAAMAGRGRLVATQFHPEKSQEAGLRLLASFLELCR